MSGIIRRNGAAFLVTDEGWGPADDAAVKAHADALHMAPGEGEALARVLATFPGVEVLPFEPLELHPPTPELPSPTPEPLFVERWTDGLTFALGGSVDVQPIWGDQENVAWAEGEPLLIVGPDGVGKTTLAHQLLFASTALVAERVLGLPVEPADGFTLYLAADRPRQAQRALYRMVSRLEEREQARLRDHVRVWQGVLDFDLVKEPAALAAFAQRIGATRVIIDSLGFVAMKLSEEETGNAIAQAFTIACTSGIDVLALYHPRKAQGDNKKPDTLADVYGSRWLTAACGSVLSLWGSPGDPVVELRHLKQPAGEVGPFRVGIDHDTGAVEVVEGTDLLGRLRAATNGLSADECVPFMEGGTDKAKAQKARRQLDGYVRRGLAHRRDGVSVRGAVSEPARYFATPPKSLDEGAR